MLPLHHDPSQERSLRLYRRINMVLSLFQQPVGESNPCSRVENPASSPLDERAVCSGSGGARILVCGFSNLRLDHLISQPQRKSLAVLVSTPCLSTLLSRNPLPAPH